MIGKLDQKVTIERRVRLKDGAGGHETTWAKIDCNPCVWASVQPRTVREATGEGRVNAAYLMQFTIRNRQDIDETCRVVWQNSTWNIRGVMRTGERSQYLTFEAERGVAS